MNTPFFAMPVLAAAPQEDLPYFVGTLLGSGLLLFLMFLGILKCIAVMRRETASTPCLVALLLFLIGWFGSAVFNMGVKQFGWMPAIQMIWWPILALLNLAALLIGIIGLVTYDRSKFKQGKSQAIWAIVLSSLSVLAAIAGVCIGFYQQTRGTFSAGVPKREDLAQYNCSVEAPKQWRKIDPKTLGIDTAALGYRHSLPEMYMLLVSEQVGAESGMDEFAGAVKRILQSAVAIEHQEEQDVTIGTLKFRRIVTSGRAEAAGLDLAYENWLVGDNGTYWRIVVWGAIKEQSTVATEARKFAENFRILVPGKEMAPAAGRLVDVKKPEWGFESHLAGQGWNSIVAKLPLGRLSISRPFSAMTVVPLRFDEESPDLESVARGLLSTMGFADPPGPGSTKTPITTPLGAGLEFTASREVEGKPFRYIIRIIRGEKQACLVAGWTSLNDMGPIKKSLDQIILMPAAGEIPAPTAEENQALGLALNEVGLSYYSRKQYATAAHWFQKAHTLAKDDEHVLHNCAEALQKAGKVTEALAVLDSELPRFPTALKLQTQRVMLMAKNGDPDAANSRFCELVGEGLNDDDVLLSWLTQLNVLDRQDLGEKAAEVWIAKHPTIDARRYQAEIIANGGDDERATALYEKLAKEYPENEQVACEFGENLNDTGNYQRAEEIAKTVLAKTPEHVRALQLLGWSQMGQHRYREAKATFESAARTSPDDPDLEAAIQRASRALGQGQNSGIKEPLTPVSLPDAVDLDVKGSALATYEKDGAAAVFLSRSVTYEFAKGKPLRRTMRRRVRVLNQAGVAPFSALEFPFDPVNERIFVNKLEVEDESGKKIATGSLDDAFVRDAESRLASEDKVLQVPVPGVKRGCTVTYEVTMEDRFPEADFPFTRHLFAYHFPCLVDAIFIKGDVSRVKEVMGAAGEVKKMQANGVLGWISKNQPGHDMETLNTSLETRAPMLWLGGGSTTWAQLGKEYLAQIASRLEPDESAVKLARDLCKGLKTDREKIEVLAREVQKEIEYQGIEFGVRARQPNSVKDILEHKFGDCKDHALLLYQLLRAVKVESHLALVQTSYRVQPELPSLDQFDHMVLHVPTLGKSWLVDPTDKELALAKFPARELWESHAFILEPGNSRLLPPFSEPPNDSSEMECHRTLTPSGNDWQVTETVTFSGYYAAEIRDEFSDESPAEQTRHAQALLNDESHVELVNFRFENLEDVNKPASLDFTYKVRNAIKTKDGKAFGAIPAALEKGYLEMAFVQNRQTPFRYRYPFHLTSVVDLKLPHAADFGRLVSHGGAHYTSWSLAPSSDSELKFDFRAKTGEWNAKEYAGFYEEWQSAHRAWDLQVTWKVD